jgi:diaminopimelate decarboxylase
MDASLISALTKAAEVHGTPVYVYDKATIVERCRSLTQAIGYGKKKLLYAMKANLRSGSTATVCSV